MYKYQYTKDKYTILYSQIHKIIVKSKVAPRKQSIFSSAAQDHEYFLSIILYSLDEI